MKKRKGPISLAGGLVDSVAATVRRMQRDREPRVLAYDPTGYARLIQPEARGHERILDIGERMVALAGEGNGSGVAKGDAGERQAEATATGGSKPKSRAPAGRSAKSAKAGAAKPAKTRKATPRRARSQATADAADGPAKAKARGAKPRRSTKDGDARPARRALRREDA